VSQYPIGGRSDVCAVSKPGQPLTSLASMQLGENGSTGNSTGLLLLRCLAGPPNTLEVQGAKSLRSRMLGVSKAFFGGQSGQYVMAQPPDVAVVLVGAAEAD